MKRFIPVYILMLVGAYAFGSAPQPGWVTSAKVVKVYDGDTVTVEVTKRMRVRLLDCWAPEVRTRDQDEKRRGIESRDYLRGLIGGQTVTLEIPTNGDVGKSISFSRLLGRIYTADGQNVSEAMVKAGYATAEKGK